MINTVEQLLSRAATKQACWLLLSLVLLVFNGGPLAAAIVALFVLKGSVAAVLRFCEAVAIAVQTTAWETQHFWNNGLYYALVF